LAIERNCLASTPIFDFVTVSAVGIAVVCALLAKVARSNLKKKSAEIAEIQRRLNEVYAQHKQTKVELASAKLESENDRFKAVGLQSIIDEGTSFFPWLLNAKSELFDLLAKKAANQLQTKKHPALKSAEEVKVFRTRAREAEQRLHRIRYRQEYCEHLFPWISEFFDDDITSLLELTRKENGTSEETEGHDDPVLGYVAKSEYHALSPVERNQRALERYVSGRKSNWQIGRDFERLTGYRLETNGYEVNYHGAIEGFEDLGRDLIARRNERTLIVQCKHWAKAKTIHEKHIYQLYGTFCDYVIGENLRPESPQGEIFGERDALKNVTPIFITTARLSDRARKAASLLNIEVQEAQATDWDYPRIKCNISRDGEKIYHLPFDQQYDRVKIEPKLGEFYAKSCADAEQKGFRRAWKWRPAN
jgi:hypothetical protein